MFRRLILLAFVAGVPSFAGAQFTTFIPPQAKAADSVKAVVVAQQKVQVDSTMTMRLTNMKAWVDSAAGIAPAPMGAADSTNSTISPISTISPTPTMRDGTRAPATASALPLFMLIGAAMLAFGLFLLGRARPVAARNDA